MSEPPKNLDTNISDEKLENFWEKLGDIPVDNDGFLEKYFLGWPSGTHRTKVWKWFDKKHSKGVAHLMGIKE